MHQPLDGNGSVTVRVSALEALHAEWTKLRTAGGTGWLLLRLRDA